MTTTRFYRRATKAGREALKNPDEAAKLGKDATAKASEHKDALGNAVDDLLTLIRLIQAYARGDYRELPARTMVAAAGAVAYFVMPIDAIPDFIPVAGYLDDVAVVLLVVDSISRDLEKFREWEESTPNGRAAKKRPKATPAKSKATTSRKARKATPAKSKATTSRKARKAAS